MQNLLSLKFDKAVAFCGRVARLKDPQSSLALLQRCAGVCRVLHLLKVVSLDIIQPFCQRLDAELLGACEISTGISLSPQSRRQAVLPTRHCGLGLRESVRLSATSFVSGVLRFRAVGGALLSTEALMSQLQRDLVDGLDIFVSACLRVHIKHGCGHRTRPASTAPHSIRTIARYVGGQSKSTSTTCVTSAGMPIST